MFSKFILQSFNNYDYYIKNSIRKLKIKNPKMKIDIDILYGLINNIDDQNYHSLYGYLDEYKFLSKFVTILFENTRKLYSWLESDNSKFIDDNLKYFSSEIQDNIITFKNFVIKFNEVIKTNFSNNLSEDIIKQIDFREFKTNSQFYDMLLKIQNDNVEFLIATCSKDELQESYDYFTNNSVDFIMADLSNK